MVARYYRELLNFLARSLQDRDAAADVAQESYARLLAVQRSGETIAEPRALLYRTARNLVIDQHRRTSVRGEADDSSLDTLAAPPAFEPEVAAASAQSVHAMLATINALPLRCREAFVLHKFDGLSQQEVAQQMGISLKMVEKHLKLALQACRQCQLRLDGPHAERDDHAR